VTAAVIGVPVATLWTAPDAPRPEDAAAVADVPDVASWARRLDGDSRLGLHGRTLTQALLGEPVDVVDEQGEWAQVVLPEQPSSSDSRGYPGWVRRAHLAPDAPDAGVEEVVVTSAVGVATSPGGPAPLSFGTRLSVADADRQRVTVILPGAGTATIAVDDVAPYEAEHAAGVPALLGSAGQFLGLRYLWGGTCAWGLDCSGLVHLVHRALGHRVPRDAFDQHAAAAPVPIAQARPGDLYFFASPGEQVHHVGLVTNEAGAEPKTMLHAPGGGELVEDAPLAGHRLSALVAAGSFLRGAAR
jgi:cell wall-associated NlpC family hydrolase